MRIGLNGGASSVEKVIEQAQRTQHGAGATDIWAAIFTVGDDASGSRRRTRALLQDLL